LYNIFYLALQDFENDPLTINAMEDPWKKGRRVMNNYCPEYAFLDYADSNLAGQATSEVPWAQQMESCSINHDWFA